MVKQFVFWLAVGAGLPGFADTIQLKDKAVVVGKVLAEKRDQVAVDIGYTVLTIPRNQIQKISRSDKPEPADAPVTAAAVTPATAVSAPAGDTTSKTATETVPRFYAAPNKPSATRTVRELVNQ